MASDGDPLGIETTMNIPFDTIFGIATTTQRKRSRDMDHGNL